MTWAYEERVCEQPSADVAGALDAIAADVSRKPTVPEVLPFVRALYEVECTGGSLHIVLDDGNLADSHVRFCLDEARKIGDRFGEALASVLLRMSVTQRAKLRAGRLSAYG